MIKKKIKLSILCSMLIPLFFSCLDALKEDRVPDLSDYSNIRMVSPDSAMIGIMRANSTGTLQALSWPFQWGADGYEILIGQSAANGSLIDTLVMYKPWTSEDGDEDKKPDFWKGDKYDGNSLTVSVLEDTYYTLLIRTLGKKDLNNLDAEKSTHAQFGSNYLLIATFPKEFPGDVEFPNGTTKYYESLDAYFEQDSIPQLMGQKVKYEFRQGGVYKLTDTVRAGVSGLLFTMKPILDPVTGASYTVPMEQLPRIVLGQRREEGKADRNAVFYNAGRELTLKYLWIERAEEGDRYEKPEDDTEGTLNDEGANPSPLIIWSRDKKTFQALQEPTGWVVAMDPITLQGCRIKTNNQLFFATRLNQADDYGFSAARYALSRISILDCFVSAEGMGGQGFIDAGYDSNRGLLQSVVVENSTIAIKASNGGRLIRMGTSRIDREQPGGQWNYTNIRFSFVNSTFYQVSRTTNQLFNSNMSSKGALIQSTLQNNLFYDCANGEVMRNGVLYAVNPTGNCFWFNGQIDTSDSDAAANGAIRQAPLLANPAGLDFTPGAAIFRLNNCGDPRWFTAAGANAIEWKGGDFIPAAAAL